MRVFIGLHEIQGHYSNLASGFNEIGIKCHFINLNKHVFGYKEKFNPLIGRMTRYALIQNKYYSKRTPFRKIFWYLTYHIFYWCLFFWAVVRHDVFIFGFGTTFFNYRELSFLKKLNKTIIFRFNGTDARPPYLNGALVSHYEKKNLPENLIYLAKKKKQDLKKIENHSDFRIANPSYGLFFEKPIIHGVIIGNQVVIDNEFNSTKKNENEYIRILHSPSEPKSKGTDKIEKIINNLIDKGYKINFIKIENRPNDEVLEEIQKCDFIVDQLYSDTPMAGFATEAAFFGKPAVVGSYYSEILKKDIPRELIPPTFFCHPNEIETAIEKMIKDPAFRKELGKRAKEFVNTYWTPAEAAKRYCQLINNNYPEYWEAHPSTFNYILGYGLTNDRLKKILKMVIEEGGENCLELNDKPDVRQKLIDFGK